MFVWLCESSSKQPEVLVEVLLARFGAANAVTEMN